MFMVKKTIVKVPPALSSSLLRSMGSHINSESKDDSGSQIDPKKDSYKGEKKDMCWQAMRRSEFRCRSDPEFHIESFINASKLCLGMRCPTRVPAADLTHYRPSDKLNREYQRTWRECEIKERKRKAVCRTRPIVFERRGRKQGNTKCNVSGQDQGLGPCRHDKPRSCPRFQLPFCKQASTVGCRPHRELECTTRPRTKYPSYSECQRDTVDDLRVECFCAKQPPMCVVWNYYRMKKS